MEKERRKRERNSQRRESSVDRSKLALRISLRYEEGTCWTSCESRSLSLGFLTSREGRSGRREKRENRGERHEREHREERREEGAEGKGERMMVGS